jgi:excisionase family DNA binding protein
MTGPWPSDEQIAEHLGITRDSIYRCIDTKGLPADKIGRLWELKVTKIDDCVRRGGARDDEARKHDGE